MEAVIISEINRRLDEKFDRRVEEKSDAKAREKLDVLKKSERPNWMKKMVDQRIKEIEEKMNANLIRSLQGPWNIMCDGCGSHESYILSPKRIEDLLRRGFIRINSDNPNCRGRLRKSLSTSYPTPCHQDEEKLIVHAITR